MQLFRSRVLLWHSLNYSWLFLCYGRSESISRFISSFYSGSCSSNPAFLCVLLITHVWNNGMTRWDPPGCGKNDLPEGCNFDISVPTEEGSEFLKTFRRNGANPQWNTSEIHTPGSAVRIILLSISPPPPVFCISLMFLKQNPNCFFSPSPIKNPWWCPLFFPQLWHCQANSNIKGICRAS